MLNRLLIAATAIAALVLVPQAAAKGVEGVTVCGMNDCVAGGPGDFGPELMGGSPALPPDRAEPWYRAQLELGDGRPGGRVFETFAVNVLPESGYIRSRDGYGGSTWSDMSAEQQAIYQRLTRGLQPFAAAELKGIAKPDPQPAAAAPSAPAAAAGDDGAGALPWLIIGGAVAALAAAAWMQLSPNARLRRRSASSH